MKTLYTNLKIKECKNDTIARADDVFSYIDSDFENWKLDVKQHKTEETEMAVLEMDKGGTFKDIFGKPTDDKCLTQAQIIEFVKTHKDKLRTEGYATFFLFKVGNEFFGAVVYLSSDGSLEVLVHRFSDVRVCYAEYRGRVVVPQLALKYSDSLTFCPHCGK